MSRTRTVQAVLAALLLIFVGSFGVAAQSEETPPAEEGEKGGEEPKEEEKDPPEDVEEPPAEPQTMGLGEIVDVPIDVDYLTRQGVEERLSPDGVNLMGDQVDMNTGALAFEAVDVSLPGNSGLEVALRRQRRQGWIYSTDATTVFGDWSVETPRISILAARPFNPWTGAVAPIPTWTQDLCSVTDPGPVIQQLPSQQNPSIADQTIVESFEYSNGLNLTVPGRTTSKVLYGLTASGMWPAGTIRATSDYWALKCVQTTEGDDGFVAIAPNGDQYKFDLFTYKDGGGVPVGNVTMPRTYAILLATEVTDVNGNWVKYEYNENGVLTRIYANDGREITLSGTGAVTANGRTWTYAYTTINGRSYLSQATLPDGRAWSYNLSGMDLEASPAYGDCNAADATVSLTHPNGATGTFVLSETRHLKGYTGVHSSESKPCNYSGGAEDAAIPYFDAMSVISKSITGPGYPSATWTYSYSGYTGPLTGPFPDTKWGQEIDPAGRKIKSTFHRATDIEGLIKMREVFTSGGALVEKTDFTYTVEAAVGTTYLANENLGKMTKPRPSYQTTLTRGSDVYNTRNTYDINQGTAGYSYGNPTKIETWSNLGGGTRVTDVVYAHNTSQWVLGLASTVTRNGVLFDSFTYDTLGRRATHSKFGTLAATFAYKTGAGEMGALASVTDALFQTVTFNNYKRGRPQQVIRKDGVSIYRTLDNNGWVTSETNGRGFTTGYSYNSAGWLTGIDRPGSWADSVITYGVPGSGNFFQRHQRGTKEVVTWYDALMRPYRVRESGLNGSGPASFVATAYDALGRATFTSFPSASSNPMTGVNTTYDALGRPLSMAENVTPFATTTYQYLSQNRTRVTDPALAQTTTKSSGYGSPDDGGVIEVIDAMNATTTMVRDIYGDITQLSQSGTQYGFTASVNRYFTYDGRRRLCRHRAPEMGDEVFSYDALDRLQYEASGQSAGSGCVTPPSGVRIAYTYDTLDRVTLTDYPAGTADIATAYDNNSNRTSVTRGSSVWTYLYNELDLMTREAHVDEHGFQMDYTYNSSGFLASRKWQWGAQIDFAPDVLGRPTKAAAGATSYISNVAYHPNGTVASLTLGNGLTLSQNINARQLVSEIKYAAGGTNIVRLTYDYDARGKIVGIDDYVTGDYNRDFGYDLNGRLNIAWGSWGSGSYKYDALGNIRQRVIGARTVDIAYDAAKNRVSSVTDTANPSRTFAHDARGNVTNDGRYTITYDLADQPVAISGSGVSATYKYDGNLKRIKSVVGGAQTFPIYSALTGGLVLQDALTAGKVTEYFGVGPAQVRIENWGAPVYTLADHLGSPVAATSAAGAVLWREGYAPFGEKLLDPAANRDNAGYTGHVQDAATKLTYMQARYYDPLIGRFYSTDPIDYRDQLNLYAYVHNDPVNNIDPDGRIAGKAIKFLRNTHKAGGNPIKGAVETIAGAAEDIGTLLDGQLNGDDITAGISLVTGLDKKDQAAIKGATNGLRRPYIRNGTREKVEVDAPRTSDGRPIDPNTGNPIDGKPDMGHKPGREFRKEKANAEAQGMSQREFNDQQNDPDIYQLEDPSSNRSHRYEEPD